MREETFSFWMPLAKAGEDADGKRWIEGIASDDGEDLQGEKVVQKGHPRRPEHDRARRNLPGLVDRPTPRPPRAAALDRPPLQGPE